MVGLRIEETAVSVKCRRPFFNFFEMVFGNLAKHGGRGRERSTNCKVEIWELRRELRSLLISLVAHGPCRSPTWMPKPQLGRQGGGNVY